jgi:hypothetical protein
MDNTLSTYLILTAIIGFIAWLGYLDWKITSLEAKLNESNFQVEKDQNDKTVDAMSMSELHNELNTFLGSGLKSSSSTTIPKP